MSKSQGLQIQTEGGKGLMMNMNLSDELWGIIQRSSPNVAPTCHLCCLSSCFKISCFPPMFGLTLRGVKGPSSFSPLYC